MDEMRLSKLMAQRGTASRREAEELIAAGRVSVNGQIVRQTVLVNPETADVRVDGKPLPDAPPKVYYLMYKPRGCITGRNDPKGRKSVLDFVEGFPFRVEPVGRLDYDTEGALLLTNDGDLANSLTHPSRKIPKRYTVKVYRTPDAGDLRAIATGIYLDDGKTAPAKVRVVEATDKTNAWVEVTVTEGRNRLVRRMFEKLGHPVSKLRRESFATLSIRGLERGQIRELTRNELRRVQDLADGVRPERAGQKKGKGFAKAKPKTRRLGRRKSFVKPRTKKR